MGAAPEGFRVVDQFVPLPSARRVHVLVPANCRPAATAALQSFVTGSGRRARLLTGVAVAGSRSGVVPRLVRARAVISVERTTPDDELPELILSRHLAQLLDTHRVELAVRVSADRPNSKPVVQLMDSAGTVLGFGKVGWNTLTRTMVEREAQVLRSLMASPPKGFDAPAIVHAGPWGAFQLLVVQPAITDEAADGLSPPIDAAREVAGIGGTERTALGASAWWSSVKERVAAISHPTVPDAVVAIERRHGEEVVTLGGVHGDWTPWNMGWRDGRLVVWDWERFCNLAPVGTDLIHYAYLVALRQRRRSADEAQADVLERVPAQLDMLDVPGTQTRLLLELHHLEMALRFAEARAAGVRTAHDLFAERLTKLISV
jgi:hypothetical protein